jgi:protocatechuate 3,4-dioxygenase beta subunit
VVAGRVVDQGGLAVPSATVTLISDSTGDRRRTASGETGEFVFPAVLPGGYSISVEASGMKRRETRNINVTGRSQTIGAETEVGFSHNGMWSRFSERGTILNRDCSR